MNAAEWIPWIKTATGVIADVIRASSPRGAEAVSFGGELASFIIEAEAAGSSPEAITQGVVDLSAQMVKRLKFGG